MPDHEDRAAPRRVLIVGGGFAGIACADKLSGHADVAVTLIDRNDYHQFQPLLYQVATYQLAGTDIGYPLVKVSQAHGGFEVRRATVVSIDPVARSVQTDDGQIVKGDVLVLAAGSEAFFFKTPGASEHSIPLYSLEDARRLRRRVLAVFDDAAADPKVIDEGALEFVVVGGGPTGVEVAGAIAQMIRTTMSTAFPPAIVNAAHVTLVDHGNSLLKAFSTKSGEYAAKVLEGLGVAVRLGTGVAEVGPGHVTLSDGSVIKTRCVVWGGGLQAAPIASAAAMPQGRGGRIDVAPDLTVAGFPGVYVVGDIANITSDGKPMPQLGSVAQQSGRWAANNILADIEGEPRKPFKYRDKGIMAMIGRGAAVAEIGEHHALHGRVAFAAWLGVHSALMTGFPNRMDAFTEWAWDYFGSHGARPLDRTDQPVIDWSDDALAETAPTPADEAPMPAGEAPAPEPAAPVASA